MITHITANNFRFPHGFLGRTGGVSTGLYSSLNVGIGSEDDPAHVRENRVRALNVVAAGAQLVSVHQVHSNLAVEAGDWHDKDRPKADALVTNRPGVAIAIVTADCAPLLFEDAAAGVIGAAHAGWKGALYGVIEATVDLMEKLGACRGRIRAAVGPCIARRSYEVSTDFRLHFEAEKIENGGFFTDGRAGHAFFDLEGFCLSRLAEAGITQAQGLSLDTKADAERFFSYRRTTLAKESDYGRQMSLIALMD